MFIFAATIAVSAVVITHLITVLRTDRPSSPPRSHDHEVDRHTMRVV